MNEDVAAAGEGGSNVTAGVDKAENAKKHKCGEGCKCMNRRPEPLKENEAPPAQPDPRAEALKAAIMAKAASLLGALKK